MIASVRGRVLEKLSDSVIIELGGVGLQVYVPAPLHDSVRRGESIFLHTYLVVREDALTLFGFESLESREYFQLLLTVNGVGPRLALAVLSIMAPDAIRRAVFHEQAEVFSRVPGVGKKTAQKILLQLQDKITPDIGLEPVGAMDDQDSEVLDALITLGYSVVEAQAAIQAIPRDAPEDVESRLMLALQYFSG